MDLSIQDKWTLITSGSHSIGFGSAEALPHDCYNIIYASRVINKLALEKDKIISIGKKCLTFFFDALGKNYVDKLIVRYILFFQQASYINDSSILLNDRETSII